MVVSGFVDVGSSQRSIVEDQGWNEVDLMTRGGTNGTPWQACSEGMSLNFWCGFCFDTRAQILIYSFAEGVSIDNSHILLVHVHQF